MRRFGIDLGTTNTCIYCANFSQLKETDDDDYFSLDSVKFQYENTGDMMTPPYEDIMPSAIYARQNKYSENGEYEYFIGKVAINAAKNDNVYEQINTKRLMCRDDPSKIVDYGLSAQDIACRLLKGCRYSIIKKYNEKVLRASKQCITQPAAFGAFASISIYEAGKEAGFTEIEPQSEPFAALLSYLYQNLDNAEKAERLLERQRKKGGRLLTLVVDIGGGTTDVTIQEIKIEGEMAAKQGSDCYTGYKINFINFVRDGNNPVASANQNPAFGGYNFDEEIVANIFQEWDEQYYQKTLTHLEPQSAHRDDLRSLYGRVKDYKEELSKRRGEFHDIWIIDGVALETVWTPEKFYGWTQKLCISPDNAEENTKTVYGIICDTIKRSGYNADDIDCFFVTGGMSYYKPVHDMIADKFKALLDEGILVFSGSPLYDIAMGAALCNNYFEVNKPDSTLYDDLMIDDPCGEPVVLVEKNTPLPTKKTLEKFMKIRNPVYVYVDVLRGHSTKDCNIQRLRRLRKPIPDNTPSGKVTQIGTDVSVEYEIDKHQAMNITLTVHDPNGEYKIPLLRLIENIDLTKGGK